MQLLRYSVLLCSSQGILSTLLCHYYVLGGCRALLYRCKGIVCCYVDSNCQVLSGSCGGSECFLVCCYGVTRMV